MSAPLSRDLRTKYTVRPDSPKVVCALSIILHILLLLQISREDLTACVMLAQVGAVPVRKDDEVTVVRGTYKVVTFMPTLGSCGSYFYR